MEATNPYAPPETLVGDVHTRSSQLQEVRAFSAKGRIGRLRFMAYAFAGYLAMIVTSVVVTLTFNMQSGTAEVLGMLLIVPYGIFVILLTIQRSHDMNWSGWTWLLALIPFVGLIWIFKSGTKGENNYGPPTQPNSLSVKILGLVFPLLIIVSFAGIIAAVALPAYQDYVKRAKATQQMQASPTTAPATQ